MIRIRFSAADFAHVRFSPRPAPLLELNSALLMMVRRDDGLLFGRWRRRMLRSLPRAVAPVGDLVPAGLAPAFLDIYDDTLEEALDSPRAWRPDLVRAELERVYAPHPTAAPPWIRALHRGDAEAWQILRRAQRSAYDHALRPVWDQLSDLHQAEFTRHALTVAEHGVGHALGELVPGALFREQEWELDAPFERHIDVDGRGLVLLPTFHWTGHPLVCDQPDRPVVVTYAAGPGIPLSPEGPAGGDSTEAALAGVLGRTRLDLLLLLADEHTTSGLARQLGVSNATVSAHTAALRGAGLISTVRAGRAVLHRRTALGGMLVRRRGPAELQDRPGRRDHRDRQGRQDTA
ncbi:ArsR/SmtB family transcription factor [Actinopolymorpha pittospori]